MNDMSKDELKEKVVDYASKVFFYCVKRCNNRSDAEDLSQKAACECLDALDRVGEIKNANAYIYDDNEHYIDFDASMPYWAGDLQALIDLIRDTSFKNIDVTVTFGYKELFFTSGELFKQWIDINKYDINELKKNGEIIQ